MKLQGEVEGVFPAATPYVRIGLGDVRFVVDTGFGGALRLPQKDYAALEFPPPSEKSDWTGMNGKAGTAPVGLVTPNWFGADRTVEIIVAGDEPLLGMGLLAGTRIELTESAVTIEPLG